MRERGQATIYKMGDVGGLEFEQLKLSLLTTAACHLATEEPVLNKFAWLFERSNLRE